MLKQRTWIIYELSNGFKITCESMSLSTKRPCSIREFGGDRAFEIPRGITSGKCILEGPYLTSYQSKLLLGQKSTISIKTNDNRSFVLHNVFASDLTMDNCRRMIIHFNSCDEMVETTKKKHKFFTRKNFEETK